MKITFCLFFSIISITGMGLILAVNPIHSILLFILTCIAMVVMALFLRFDFIFIVFILIYFGAIVVLFLFVIMTIQTKNIKLHFNFIAFFAIALILFLVLILSNLLVLTPAMAMGHSHYSYLPFFLQIDLDWFCVIDTEKQAALLPMFNLFFLFLLLVGIILLCAVIGSITITDSLKEKNIKRQLTLVQSIRKAINSYFFGNKKF